MFRTPAPLARTFAALAVGLLALSATSATAASSPASEGATDTYVVVLRDSVGSVGTVASRQADRVGADLVGVYSQAIKGYTAEMSAADAARLRSDPNVAFVERDQMLHITQTGPAVPTGVRRINAPANPNIDIDGVDDNRINVDVAIIDTGVSAHSDLNVVARVNCSTGVCVTGGTDANGHGTHVAGTVAAIDNATGVVGVAPGARIHSVRVCNVFGQCSLSAIIAGVNYVTARASTIEVVNVSLGGPGSSGALNTALTNSVNAGVVYAVAAGNSNQNASGFFPASHPDVITVSAIADSDGLAGGTGGAPSCRTGERDDFKATFSNYGATVEVAAPGVCIRSTWNNGGFNTISGTSMATPHVTGAAALLASGPRDPTNRTQALAIRSRIIATGNGGWTDTSPDGIKEPLLDVGSSSSYPGP
jgi:subtilisin